MSRDAFLRNMTALQVDVSRETIQRLDILCTVLAKWQKAINLVSNNTLTEVWTRHLLDSAQLLPLLPPDARSLADLGTGAGFPGLVLSAFRPDLAVTLVESDVRKGAYLGEAARQMGLASSIKISLGRIETVAPVLADVITARALAPLTQLLGWAARHRAPEGICLFHKGAKWRTELDEALQEWEISYEPTRSITDRDAVLLRIRSFSATDHRDRQSEGRGR